MLDSAGVMMTQYQNLAARLQLSVAPQIPVNSGANSSREQAAAGPAVYDKPTTSATARAQLETHQINSTPVATVAGAEKVTIEDLGADEDDEPSTATETVSLAISDADIDENSSELSELRKRRLKFLEERNKSSSGSELRTTVE